MDSAKTESNGWTLFLPFPSKLNLGPIPPISPPAELYCYKNLLA